MLHCVRETLELFSMISQAKHRSYGDGERRDGLDDSEVPAKDNASTNKILEGSKIVYIKSK